MNQQADPQAESVPTRPEERHVAKHRRNCSGSRQSSQLPCIAVCSPFVASSTTSAPWIGSGAARARFADFTSTAVAANRKPAPRPHSAAGCTVARATSAALPTRPASESTSTPPTPIRMPSHAKGEILSPSRSSASTAPCAASVFAYAVPTAKLR